MRTGTTVRSPLPQALLVSGRSCPDSQGRLRMLLPDGWQTTTLPPPVHGNTLPSPARQCRMRPVPTDRCPPALVRFHEKRGPPSPAPTVCCHSPTWTSAWLNTIRNLTPDRLLPNGNMRRHPSPPPSGVPGTGCRRPPSYGPEGVDLSRAILGGALLPPGLHTDMPAKEGGLER